MEKGAELKKENAFLVGEELVFLSAQNMRQQPKTLTWRVKEGNVQQFFFFKLTAVCNENKW